MIFLYVYAVFETNHKLFWDRLVTEYNAHKSTPIEIILDGL